MPAHEAAAGFPNHPVSLSSLRQAGSRALKRHAALAVVLGSCTGVELVSGAGNFGMAAMPSLLDSV
jgi:hypothetical protein